MFAYLLFGNISIATRKLDANHPAFPSLTSAEEAMDKAIGLTNHLLTFAKGGEPMREVLDFAWCTNLFVLTFRAQMSNQRLGLLMT